MLKTAQSEIKVIDLLCIIWRKKPLPELSGAFPAVLGAAGMEGLHVALLFGRFRVRLEPRCILIAQSNSSALIQPRTVPALRANLDCSGKGSYFLFCISHFLFILFFFIISYLSYLSYCSYFLLFLILAGFMAMQGRGSSSSSHIPGQLCAWTVARGAPVRDTNPGLCWWWGVKAALSVPKPWNFMCSMPVTTGNCDGLCATTLVHK